MRQTKLRQSAWPEVSAGPHAAKSWKELGFHGGKIVVSPGRAVFRRPGWLLPILQRDIRAGLSLEEDRPAFETDHSMKLPCRDVCPDAFTFCIKKQLLFHCSIIIENQDAEFSADDNERFILQGIEMSVRPDIRRGFHGVQQPVRREFIMWVDVPVLPEARVRFGCCSYFIKQLTVDYFHEWLSRSLKV